MEIKAIKPITLFILTPFVEGNIVPAEAGTGIALFYFIVYIYTSMTFDRWRYRERHSAPKG